MRSTLNLAWDSHTLQQEAEGGAGGRRGLSPPLLVVADWAGQGPARNLRSHMRSPGKTRGMASGGWPTFEAATMEFTMELPGQALSALGPTHRRVKRFRGRLNML